MSDMLRSLGVKLWRICKDTLSEELCSVFSTAGCTICVIAFSVSEMSIVVTLVKHYLD